MTEAQAFTAAPAQARRQRRPGARATEDAATPIGPGHRTTRGRAREAAALAAVLVLAAVVRWTPPRTAAELRPRPDALEYEEAAHNLLRGDGYSIILDGEKYPPRYPFGFSALLVPALALSGDEPGDGIFVVLASALAAVAATWGLARMAGGPASGLAAALLLALAPLHVGWSQTVMSDVPGSALTAAIALAALAAWRRRASAVAWACIGVAGGLAATVRATSALVLLPAAVLAAVAGGVPAMALLGVGAIAGVAPLFAYQAIRFGSPFRDGYSAWVPMALLDVRYVLGPPAFGGETSNISFYAAQLAGLGTLYPWPVALLLVTGATLAARGAAPARALGAVAGGTLLAVLAVVLPFFWQGDRFFVPVLPLVAAIAGLPFSAAQPRAVRIGALALALAAGVIVARRATPFPDVAPDHREAAALRAWDALLEPEAVLVVHADPYLVRRFVRRDTARRWMPIGESEHERLLHLTDLRPFAAAPADAGWTLPPLTGTVSGADVAARFSGLLADGHPVYVSPLLQHEVPVVAALLQFLAARFRVRLVTDLPAPLYRVSDS